ncbi:MAG: hypothetical protein LLG05_03405 [Porphyromonadaceae bacterium]|nr:hypothetical protein [Porphyromonadaceae bacterium]
MKIARVFPTVTTATPDDELSFHDVPPMLFPPQVDEVHISVAFTWDRQRAEFLAGQWSMVAPVKIGGPGWANEPGADFVPGRYLRPGYVITSRGCPNSCWFCSVPKREPGLRELPVMDGWIVQDDNLLACSERHIRQVFAMLKRQRNRAQLMGLEAARLESWHIDLMRDLRPAALWFAMDTPDDTEPLRAAGLRLWKAGFNFDKLYCYVLVGHPRDTYESAESRLRQACRFGFLPFAMQWRDQSGYRDPEWVTWSRPWKRPAAIKAMCALEIAEVRKNIHQQANYAICKVGCGEEL